ncbi:Peptide hydrolase [Mycena venus]|uniref:Peptide hydrolase n=1 Tax=Mycena venus TaxID=2733690 RepID=A0A8H6YPM2_9AGAR|nr:Peptide hydrolase [Mycena venus]
MPTRILNSHRNREPRETHSRNPGRRDAFRWNSDAFICPASVDGFRCDERDASAALDLGDNVDPDDVRGVEADLARPASAPHEVALVDIARQAKLKGVAKEFEVVDAPRRVIVLDEDAFSVVDGPSFLDGDDSEWEDIDAFADSAVQAGPSTRESDYETQDSDYLLARRLQDEEYTRAGFPGIAKPGFVHETSDTQRRAYAHVLAASNG